MDEIAAMLDVAAYPLILALILSLVLPLRLSLPRLTLTGPCERDAGEEQQRGRNEM
jgi:hypothetical protein